ncbi:unnamed protein product [Thlaspi arvense]|uniref:Uncharacterized protein n=1 Tax=Thlaspi arvense TaxID=13288 RepID=A0AAU9SJR5_THLAR|nr:unnamed protein product [Thlaspi arvense]
MDEDAMKGLQLLEMKDSDAAIPEIPKFSGVVTVSVEGYDTLLPPEVVAKALRRHFSCCGKVIDVALTAYTETDVFLPFLYKFATLRIRGEGVEEKALRLSGSDVGGWTVVVAEAYPCDEPIGIEVSGAERAKEDSEDGSAKSSSSWESCVIKVTGHDTPLPVHGIESALRKHFASCGQIMAVAAGDPSFLIIDGKGAQEKALSLSGSYMGGCKLVAEPSPKSAPEENGKRIYGAPHLARWDHIVKARMLWGAEMAKTMKITDKAKMVWEEQMGPYMDAEDKKMLWEAEMARRDMQN